MDRLAARWVGGSASAAGAIRLPHRAVTARNASPNRMLHDLVRATGHGPMPSRLDFASHPFRNLKPAGSIALRATLNQGTIF